MQQRDRGRRIDQFLWDLQDREEEFERAADGSTEATDPRTDPKTAEKGVVLLNSKKMNREKRPFFAVHQW